MPDPNDADSSGLGDAVRAVFNANDGLQTVVYSTSDNYSELFSKIQVDADPGVHFGQEVRADVLKRVLDKTGLPELADAARVSAPRTIVNDVSALRALQTPLIVKPAMKRKPGLDVEGRVFRLQVCHTHSEAEAAAERLVQIGVGFVVQELVGDASSLLHTVGLVAKRGEVLAAETAVKIRQFPRRFGECSFGTTTSRPDLVEIASRLARESCLSGIAQIEFLEHEGRSYLIEINPRLWSWHEIHAVAGRDLVRIATLAALEKDHDELLSNKYRVGATWQFATMDTLHNLGVNRPNAAVLSSILTRDREAFFYWLDPQVFIAHIAQTLKNVRHLLVSARQARASLDE